jgi:hypothetical protein
MDCRSGSLGSLQSAIINVDQQNALKQFVRNLAGNSLQRWSDVIDEYVTKIPLFYVTDANHKLVFDDNYPCHSIIQNMNDPSRQISSSPDVFTKSSGSNTGGSNPGSSFFTVYASGLCDPVRFEADQYCQQGGGHISFELHVNSFGSITVPAK